MYAAFYGGNLLTRSLDPEHATCRELLKLGLTGKARFWREGKPVHDLEMDIERGARLSTGDSRARLITRRWQAFEGRGEGERGSGGA